MRWSVYPLIGSLVTGTSVLVAGIPAGYCNGIFVYDVLKQLPQGRAFCSAFLYPTGGRTTTSTSTVLHTSCRSTTTDTKTKLLHRTNTLTLGSAVTTEPTIRITEYTSTVLVPSGPTHTVNKRDAEAAPAPAAAAACPTPTEILGCALSAISAGCESLVPPDTITVRRTEITRPICTRTTTQTIQTTDALVISYYPVTVDPAPTTLFPSGILTTTVPVACAGSTYDSGGVVGEGNGIFPQAYPNFPQTGVECCVLCWNTPGCIASAFIDSAGECDFLMRINGTEPGVSRKCPKGVIDYPFGSPNDQGVIYPGPCGR